jgi:hypothetical protein
MTKNIFNPYNCLNVKIQIFAFPFIFSYDYITYDEIVTCYYI